MPGDWLAVLSPWWPGPIAVNRAWAASSWAAIMSLTSASSGVSGRRISARSAGTSGPYFRASLDSFGPVVWMTHGVVGEIRRLDYPRPRAGRQAGDDVLAVLLVLVAAGLPFGVGDCGDQGGGACAEPPGQHRQGRLPAAAGGDVGRVVLDGVVQQRGARHVGVGDPVVADRIRMATLSRWLA